MDVLDSWKREYEALSALAAAGEITGRETCQRKVLAYRVRKYSRDREPADVRISCAVPRSDGPAFRETRIDFASLSLSLKLAAVTLLLGWILVLGGAA